jgi:hypothetical protein
VELNICVDGWARHAERDGVAVAGVSEAGGAGRAGVGWSKCSQGSPKMNNGWILLTLFRSMNSPMRLHFRVAPSSVFFASRRV